MRKLFLVALTVSVSFLTASSTCLSCTFPDGRGMKAPGWVCSDTNISVKGYPIVSSGSSPITKVGGYYDKDMAIMNAKDRLAGRIKTAVTRELKKYLAVIGNDSRVVDKYVEDVSIHFTKITLNDCPVLATTTSADAVYVLVGVGTIGEDDKTIAKLLSSSFKNNEAQFQRDLAKDSFKELKERSLNAEKEFKFSHENDVASNPNSKYITHPETGELVLLVPKEEWKETAEKE